MDTITGLVVSGKKFAGKDTLLEHLRAVIADYYVVRHKWADSLRRDIIKMLAAVGITVTMEELETPGLKEKYTALLQWYGTDLRRAKDPDYWVSRGIIEMLSKNYVVRGQGDLPVMADPFWVNTDTRFPNEVLLPRRHGFLSVRLNVGREEQYLRALVLGQEFNERLRLHSSELALDDFGGFDLVVDANRDPREIHADVDRFLIERGIRLWGVVQ